MALPNRTEFEKVRKELANGEPLTFQKMARVFGFDVYELVLLALISAEEASSVIQEATWEANKEVDESN